jgi:hypothetical protein
MSAGIFVDDLDGVAGGDELGTDEDGDAAVMPIVNSV